MPNSVTQAGGSGTGELEGVRPPVQGPHSAARSIQLPACPPPHPGSARLPACPCQVLLFSTMTRALDVVEELLSWRGYGYIRMDGTTATADRGQMVADFNAPGEPDSCLHCVACKRTCLLQPASSPSQARPAAGRGRRAVALLPG